MQPKMTEVNAARLFIIVAGYAGVSWKYKMMLYPALSSWFI
jgi:hypothetical protein